jgi:hypothetical protein
VRVSELRQAVESRDRKIAEQERTIARLRAIGDELRAKVTRLEVALATSEASKKRGAWPHREGAPSGRGCQAKCVRALSIIDGKRSSNRIAN